MRGGQKLIQQGMSKETDEAEVFGKGWVVL